MLGLADRAVNNPAAYALSAEERTAALAKLTQEGFSMSDAEEMLALCLTWLSHVADGNRGVIAAAEFDPAWHALVSFPWYEEFVERFSSAPIDHVEYGISEMSAWGWQDPNETFAEITGLPKVKGFSKALCGPGGS